MDNIPWNDLFCTVIILTVIIAAAITSIVNTRVRYKSTSKDVLDNQD